MIKKLLDINGEMDLKEKQAVKACFWSGRQDSNLRPLAPHASALPGCATSRGRAANLQLYWLRNQTCILVCATSMTEERQKRIESVLSKRQENITVVLENVFDPHNISAVMRSCDAVGIQELYVLNSKIPRHKKWGARSSSSAAKWLTIHQFEDVNECLAALRKKYEIILTTHLS